MIIRKHLKFLPDFIIIPATHENGVAREELQMIVGKCQAGKQSVLRDGGWHLSIIKANRKKLLLVWLVTVGGQNTSPLIIDNYNVQFYGSFGLGPSTFLLY